MEPLNIPTAVPVPDLLERLPKIMLRKLGNRLLGKIQYDETSTHCRVTDEKNFFAIDFHFLLDPTNKVIRVAKPIKVELLPQSQRLMAGDVERTMRGMKEAHALAVEKLRDTSFVEDRHEFILNLLEAEKEFRKDCDIMGVLRKLGFAKTSQRDERPTFTRRIGSTDTVLRLFYPATPKRRYAFDIPLDYEMLDDRVDARVIQVRNPFWYLTQYVRREQIFTMLEGVGLRKFLEIRDGFAWFTFNLLTEAEAYDAITAVLKIWHLLQARGKVISDGEDDVKAHYEALVRQGLQETREL